MKKRRTLQYILAAVFFIWLFSWAWREVELRIWRLSNYHGPNGQTVASISVLKSAVERYVKYYDKLPIITINEPFFAYGRADLVRLDYTLRGEDLEWNPDRKVFYEPYLIRTAQGRVKFEPVEFLSWPVDGYGRPLFVYFDTEGDGTIVVGGVERYRQPGVIVGGTEVNDSIAIWSSGENGINEYGEGDDICSWKKLEVVDIWYLSLEVRRRSKFFEIKLGESPRFLSRLSREMREDDDSSNREMDDEYNSSDP